MKSLFGITGKKRSKRLETLRVARHKSKVRAPFAAEYLSLLFFLTETLITPYQGVFRPISV